MTAEQLLATFPACREAVAWGELMVPWDDIHRGVAQGLAVPELLDTFEVTVREALAEPDCPNPAQLGRVLEQLRTPAFTRYLAGKLGMA